MGNDFLEAARNSKSDDSSEERYQKVKEEQAGTDMTESEQRYQELKEEAKDEFIEKQKERKAEEAEETEDDTSEDEEGGFITH